MHKHQRFASRVFVPALLLLVMSSLGDLARAQLSRPLNHWSNRTSSQNVEELSAQGEPEMTRLAQGSTQGELDGSTLLGGGVWEIVFGVTAPSNVAPGEVVRVFLNGGLLKEFRGMQPGETRLDSMSLFTATVPGLNRVDYRIEYESQVPDADRHLILVRGTGLQRSPLPSELGRFFCALSPNSVGQGTFLSALGSRRVSDDDFRLVATGAPPGRTLVFFAGIGERQTPFGSGFLCVGAQSGLRRVSAPLTVDASGSATERWVLAPHAGTLIGSTVGFQAYYTDPAGGPQGFNLSEAFSVNFQP